MTWCDLLHIIYFIYNLQQKIFSPCTHSVYFKNRQVFNIQKFCVLIHRVHLCVLYWPLYQVIWISNRDRVCLLCVTNWFFVCNSGHSNSFKGLENTSRASSTYSIIIPSPDRYLALVSSLRKQRGRGGLITHKRKLKYLFAEISITVS